MPMFYPCNYGYINKTVSGDGDPVDVLVITEYPLIPGCIIKARPIGVLMMEDESGVDEKILTVPTKKISPLYEHINSYKDLPAIVPLQISSFFEHYKKLEKNKWVKLLGWEDADKAHQLILQAIKNYQDVKDL
jgi:inorganic pyrophosphatase